MLHAAPSFAQDAGGAGATGESAVRDQPGSFWDILGEDDPHPANFEFSFLSVAANQNIGLAHWGGGGIYFGAGGGIGTTLYKISKIEDRDVGIDPTIEALFANLYFRIAPFRYLDLDFGGRIAVGSTGYDVPDSPRGAFVRAGYADLRIGSKKIKVGPRFEYVSTVYADFNEVGWKLSPLMLRVMM